LRRSQRDVPHDFACSLLVHGVSFSFVEIEFNRKSRLTGFRPPVCLFIPGSNPSDIATGSHPRVRSLRHNGANAKPQKAPWRRSFQAPDGGRLRRDNAGATKIAGGEIEEIMEENGKHPRP
jgi:hypothetical protein